MGYIMELSFNILKNKNISEITANIKLIANLYQCNHFYDYIEMENEYNKYIINKNVTRNHYIIVIEFDEENILNFSKFIKIIQRMKNIYLECIYQDNIICKIIYASPYYLKTMDKDKIINYKKFKKDEIYLDNEIIILQEIYDKKVSANTI